MEKKSGLICPDGHFESMNYYDIYNYAKEVCVSYTKKDQNNYNHFSLYQDKYSVFEPYLDFLLSELHYILINPLGYDNVIEYSLHHKIVLKQVSSLDLLREDLILQKGECIYYTECNDSNLNVRKFSVCGTSDGIVSPKGEFFVLDRNKDMYHDVLAQQILNQLLIKDQELYLSYLSYLESVFGDEGIIFPMNFTQFAIRYLSTMLGYIWFSRKGNFGDYIYNSKLITDEVKPIINSLKSHIDQYMPIDFAKDGSFLEEEIVKSKRMMSKVL